VFELVVVVVELLELCLELCKEKKQNEKDENQNKPPRLLLGNRSSYMPPNIHPKHPIP
jgi:hypothetical protein